MALEETIIDLVLKDALPMSPHYFVAQHTFLNLANKAPKATLGEPLLELTTHVLFLSSRNKIFLGQKSISLISCDNTAGVSFSK